MFGAETKVNLELIKKCLTGATNTSMAGLIKKLITRGAITSEKVCNAMLQTDRGQFCDTPYAYYDM